MEALKEKLKDNVLIEATTGCWLWQRSVGSHGYGQIRYRKKLYTTHQASYTAFIGEIPKGLVVRHTCDVRECCNPEHLLIGTYQDNADDMVSRSRSNLGEKHPAAKLTWDKVRKIRASDETVGQLAETYNVSPSHIINILNNRKWVE